MSEFLEIDDGNCPPFSLALPDQKSGYHRWLIETGICTEVAVFALDYLCGRGTLIDVGANIGAISTPVAVAGSRVVSIEMIPEHCLYLSQTVLRNRLRKLRLFQLAVSDDRGMAGFEATPENGFVRPEGGRPAMKLPLDDVIELLQLQERRFIRPPLLIKIDTEGHELFVLRGAERLTERFSPAFFFESVMIEGRHDTPDDRAVEVKRLLEQRGYHLYLHRHNILIPRKSSDVQEGFVSDYFASKRKYRPGSRIGRHRVASIAFNESLSWIKEMIDYPFHMHRMHAAGVIARWLADGIEHPLLSTYARQLRDHDDARVAEYAHHILSGLC